MSDAQPGPDPDAGINALRLDADRARDALQSTLSEIESRLDPQRVIRPVKGAVASLKNSYTDNPVGFLAVAAVLTVTVAGIVVLLARSGRRRG